MNSFNTIEVKAADENEKNALHMDSAQDGLIPVNSNIKEDDLDDDKIASRKFSISQAIQEQDGDKKIPIAKKTKKKKKGKKPNTKDINILSVNNVDEDVDSWNSARN